MPLSASPSKVNTASEKPAVLEEKTADGSAATQANEKESDPAVGASGGEETADMADLAMKAVGEKVEVITQGAADLIKFGASSVKATYASAAATIRDVVHGKEVDKAPEDGKQKPDKSPEKNKDAVAIENGEKAPEDGKQKPEKSPEKDKDAVDGGILSRSAAGGAASAADEQSKPEEGKGQTDKESAGEKTKEKEEKPSDEESKEKEAILSEQPKPNEDESAKEKEDKPSEEKPKEKEEKPSEEKPLEEKPKDKGENPKEDKPSQAISGQAPSAEKQEEKPSEDKPSDEKLTE